MNSLEEADMPPTSTIKFSISSHAYMPLGRAEVASAASKG